jgi:hypothetical protein
MKFEWHILIGTVASFCLIQFFNFSLLSGIIIFLSSLIIDIDHYLWYIFEIKKYNPIESIKWYYKSRPKWFSLSLEKRNKFKSGIFIFHSIPFCIILTLLGFIHEFFWLILIGVAIHIATDIPYDTTIKKEPFYNKIFPCYVMIRNKNKKGLDKL